MCKCKTGVPYPDGTCDQCGHKDGSKALQHITECFIASEEPKMKDPYDLCDAVEKLPASEQQTIVSLMAYKVVKSLLACEQEIARLKINFEEVETAWLLARKDLSAIETLCCEEGFESWWEKNWSDDHDDEMTQKDYALAGWNAAASNAWRTTAKEALAELDKEKP